MPKTTSQSATRSTFPHEVFRRSTEQNGGPTVYFRSLKQHGRLLHELVHECLVQHQATTRNLARRLEAYPLLDHSPFAACVPADRIDKANAIAGDRWLGCFALAIWLYRNLLSVHQENGLPHEATERAFGQVLLYAFASEWITRIQNTGNPQAAWVFSLLLCGAAPTDLVHLRTGRQSWQIDHQQQIVALLPYFNYDPKTLDSQHFLAHQLITLRRVTNFIPGEFRSIHLQPLMEAQAGTMLERPLDPHLSTPISEQFAQLAVDCQKMAAAIDQLTAV